MDKVNLPSGTHMLPPEVTTVTKVSKTVALIVFMVVPIIAFFMGRNYQSDIDNSYYSYNLYQNVRVNSHIPTPTAQFSTPSAGIKQ